MLNDLKKKVAAQTAANGGKPRNIKVMDTLFRDAHQCLWATRMRTEDMLPIARTLDEVGFDNIEAMGLVQYDAAVRFLNQNPFTRLRLLRERITNTRIRGLLRGNLLGGFAPVHDDITDLFATCQVANGAREHAQFDSLHDIDVMVPGAKITKSLGAKYIVAVLYNHAPGYDDAYYEAVTREACEKLKPDGIQLVDAGGTMPLERVRTLVPAIRGAMPDHVTLELNTHCMTGLGPLVALEAAIYGVDTIYTAPELMAQGNAAPGSQMIVRNLRELGFEVDIDLDALTKVEDYLRDLAIREGKPIGRPNEFNEGQYVSQMAGGALSNVESQLKEAGIHHRLPEVIEEVGRVRMELGSPIMATPYPAIIAAQAVMNVVQGERYKVVPAEVKKYICGYYGNLRIPVDPNVVDLVMENGPRSIPETPEPLEPIVPKLRARYPRASDDELVLRYIYGDERYEGLNPTLVRDEMSADNPIATLVDRLSKRPNKSWIHVSGANFKLSLGPNS